MSHKKLLIAIAICFLAFTVYYILIDQREPEHRRNLSEPIKKIESSGDDGRLESKESAEKKPIINNKTKHNEPEIRNIKRRRRIAIIIDDVGIDMLNFTELMNINYPLTISILPFRRFSKICSEIAVQKGHEVMLHQPMQPGNSDVNKMGAAGITVDMPENKIRSIINKNLSSMNHLKGMNNHMGSLATRRRDIMGAVMTELKIHKLYFVDSITTGGSVAYDEAIKMKVPAVKRDIFIDAREGYGYALHQLKKLQRIAQKKNTAVAIGHSKITTIRALEKVLPEIEKNGIKVVTVSKLLEEKN